jgi:hypothetical protein
LTDRIQRKKVRIRKYFLLIFLFTTSCNISNNQEITQFEESPRNQKPYFVAAPITKWSTIQAPCLDIRIENKTFSVELDLGFRGDLTFTKQWVETLSSKTFLREKPMYGIRGKEYATKLYQIPALEIGKMTFFKPILQEEKEEFAKDSTFVQNRQEQSPKEPGRLGWELFYNVNLLVDAENSLIAFCDGLETLAKQGYEIQEFTRSPLLLERGLVEFDAETSEGTLRCVLDTGATWNMLNCEIGENKSIDDLMWHVDSIVEYSSLKINGKDFGPISLHKLPIKIPIRIEAILGMDFFKNHILFLDFRNNYVYFSKNKANID